MAGLPNHPEVNQLFPNLEPPQQKVKLSGVQGFLLIQQVIQRGQGHHYLVYIRDTNGRRLKARQARDLLDNIRLRLI